MSLTNVPRPQHKARSLSPTSEIPKAMSSNCRTGAERVDRIRLTDPSVSLGIKRQSHARSRQRVRDRRTVLLPQRPATEPSYHRHGSDGNT